MGYRKCLICGAYFEGINGFCKDGYEGWREIGRKHTDGVFCSRECYEEWRDTKWERERAEKAAARAAEAAEERAEAAERRAAEEAERRRKEEEHDRLLARCVNIDGAYYSQDKTTLIEVDKMTRRLVVPEGVLEIADNACKECKSLKSVTLPESLEEIGEAAFCFVPRLHL